nr:hypothetical protein CFP56_05350 [Quercus suber]
MTIKESNGKRSTFVIQKVGMYHIFGAMLDLEVVLRDPSQQQPSTESHMRNLPLFQKPHLFNTSKPLFIQSLHDKIVILPSIHPSEMLALGLKST